MLPIINIKGIHFKDGKRTFQHIPKKGTLMNTCATMNEKYICCRVHVLKSVHNCPFECSYCFLQNYLTDGTTKIVGDIDTLMEEVKSTIVQEPERLFRIGTWELGDSLALENASGQAARLISEFAKLDNSVLELKTKSDRIDSILHADHGGRTIVSWSLNPQLIIEREERGTAPLEKRLAAMHKVCEAGFPVGLHFDPMIEHDGWQEGYRDLVTRIFKTVPPERVAWISMGSLRFNPEMKKKIENNYPDSMLTSAEMVLGDDAKMRYVKPLRIEMYKSLYGDLKKHITDTHLVYLCMERWDVWDRVFGHHPESIGHLDYLFAKSMYERFGLGNQEPDPGTYAKSQITNSK